RFGEGRIPSPFPVRQHVCDGEVAIFRGLLPPVRIALAMPADWQRVLRSTGKRRATASTSRPGGDDMSDTFDRSQLDGKDREQLSEIAAALGVKSISRMRKADLVEAIAKAAGTNEAGSNGSDAAKTKKVRSTRAAGVDDLASIADEE